MKTIVLIEDSADNRLIVTAMLRDRYRIRAYANGYEGLDGIRDELPDLVLLDISLPGKDGLEVLRDIRRDPALCQLPVVAFTAHAMAGDQEKFIAEGFNDYLTKPIIDESILVDTLERWL